MPGRAVAPLGARSLTAAGNGSLVGRHWARSPSRTSVALAASSSAPALELAPPVRVEQIAAGEHVHVAGEAVPGADVVPLAAVHLLQPEAVVPLVPEPVRRLAPGVREPLVAGALEHELGGEHRPRRAPHQLTGRVVDVRPHAREHPLDVIRRGRQPVGDEQDRPTRPRAGTGPAAVASARAGRAPPGSARAGSRQRASSPRARERRQPALRARRSAQITPPRRGRCRRSSGSGPSSSSSGWAGQSDSDRRRPRRRRRWRRSPRAPRLAPLAARERLVRRAVVEVGRHRVSVCVTIPGPAPSTVASTGRATTPGRERFSERMREEIDWTLRQSCSPSSPAPSSRPTPASGCRPDASNAPPG